MISPGKIKEASARLALLFFSLILFTTSPVAATTPLFENNEYLFTDEIMDLLPGSRFYQTYLENVNPGATVLIEESNGFSMIDDPRIFYEGDPFNQFRWYLDGFRIDSALRPGTPAVSLPLGLRQGYRLSGTHAGRTDTGFHFLTPDPKKNIHGLSFSGVYSDLGSYISEEEATGYNQLPKPSSERRKIQSSYLADYVKSHQFKNGSALALGVSAFQMDRDFNDFNRKDSTFSEDSGQVDFLARFDTQLGHWDMSAFSGIKFNSRDNLFAELGRLPQETYERDDFSGFLGAELKRDDLLFRFSFQREDQEITPNVLNFEKDLRDIDGEGMYPFEKWGDFSSNTVVLDGEYRTSYKPVNVTYFANIRNSTIYGDEGLHDYHPILVDGEPYQVLTWDKTRSYTNHNLNIRAGVTAEWQSTPRLRLFSKAYLSHTRLIFEDSSNDTDLLSPCVDFGIEFRRTDKDTLSFHLGYLPADVNEETNFFLERQRPSGTYRFWNDLNGDGQFQEGEAGELFGRTGGNTHLVDDDLKQPGWLRAMILYDYRLSPKWTMNLKLLYKRMFNPLWVRHPENNGFYETVNGERLFFYNEPFDTFELTNKSVDDDPFYAEALLQVSAVVPKKWYFSASFMAHMGMGSTVFADGPSSDIGLLDETMANPNSWVNSFGRVDGDRGFVAKLLYGFYLADKATCAFTVKYRDGSPFAFVNAVNRHGQWVFYNDTIKGEDDRGKKGGPRENSIIDLSARLNYFFKVFQMQAMLFVEAYNILDLGYELSENVLHPTGWRDPNELQIPRSARFGLNISF